MLIKRVSIKNFCQHEKRVDDLGPGVIGVFGGNGRGKSNYLKAIHRAITGESGNIGKKEDDVRWDSDGGYVDVEFIVNGQVGKIHRDLKTARCKLDFGGVTYKTATEIDRIIYSIIGVQPKILSDIVFVNQGQIEGILFQKPAERARALQALFGTDKAETIRSAIYDELQVAVVNSRADAILKLETQLSVEVRKPLAEALAKLAGLLLLSDDERRRQQQISSDYLAYTQAAAQANSARLDAANYQTQLAEAQGKLMEADLAALELQALIAETQEDESKAKAALAAEQINQMHFRSLKQLETLIADAEKHLAAPEPQHTVDEAVLATDEAELNKLQAKLGTSKEICRVGTGKQECPVCRQPINAAHIAEHQAQVTELEPKVAALLASLFSRRQQVLAFHKARSSWQTNRSNWEQALNSASERLVAIPEFELLTPERHKELTELVSTFAGVQQTYNGALSHKNGCAVRAEQLDKSLRLALQRAEEAKLASGAGVAEEAYRSAQKLLLADDTNRMASAELKGKIQLLESREGPLVKDIEEYKKQEQQLTKLKAWRDMLEWARAVLHRDQLPNLVAQRFLKTMNVKLAKYLDMFDVPFASQIMPDLSMECSFPGQRRVMAERLSGGEKVMLGIAFRFAVYDLFVANLGVMVLDEPTVYLDDDRIDCVFALLERVKSYSQSAGLQLIVVTHEQRLAGVFDRVITL